MSYGLILDVDGVLADTEGLIAQATIAMFRELYDVEMTPGDFAPFIGMGSVRYVEGAAAAKGVAIDTQRAIRKRQENYVALLEASESITFPGVLELIDRLHTGSDWKLAIATSAPSDKAGATLAAANVPLERFAAYITGDMVAQKKPHPEIYLTASNVIGIPPARCVVIEDAPAGIESAHAAGMACVAVTTTFDAAALAKADLIVRSLAEIDPGALYDLVT